MNIIVINYDKSTRDDVDSVLNVRENEDKDSDCAKKSLPQRLKGAFQGKVAERAAMPPSARSEEVVSPCISLRQNTSL